MHIPLKTFILLLVILSSRPLFAGSSVFIDNPDFANSPAFTIHIAETSSPLQISGKLGNPIVKASINATTTISNAPLSKEYFPKIHIQNPQAWVEKIASPTDIDELLKIKQSIVKKTIPTNPLHYPPADQSKSGSVRIETLKGSKEMSVRWYQGNAYIGDMLLGSAQQIQRNLESEAKLGTPWPMDKIPYIIRKESFPESIADDMVDRIHAAMDEWEENTQFEFEELPEGFLFVPEWVEIVYDAHVCAAYPGYAALMGAHQVQLNSACTKGSIMHEFGHVLGLLHEMVRSDRDQHLSYHEDEVNTENIHNFTRSIIYTPDTEFNFNSLMMYDTYAFTKNGWPTLTRKHAIGGPVTIGLPAEEWWQTFDNNIVLSPLAVNWFIPPIETWGTPLSHFIVGNFDGIEGDDILNPTYGLISYNGSSEWQPFNNDPMRYLGWVGYDVAIGDFNGDGLDDVFRSDGQVFRVSYGAASGLYTINDMGSSNAEMRNLKLGDFDGNGKTDVLWTTGTEWKIIPDGRDEPYTSTENTDILAKDLHIGDFDCDDKADIFWANGRQWWIHYSTTNEWKILGDISVESSEIRVGNFGSDCADDLAVVDNDTMSFVFLSATEHTLWGIGYLVSGQNVDLSNALMGKFNSHYYSGLYFEGYYKTQRERIEQSDLDSVRWLYDNFR